MLRRPLPLLLVILVLGCGGSPTEPSRYSSNPYAGRWSGNLGERVPAGEDWSAAVVDLQQDGTLVTGVLRERNGKIHELRGTIENGRARLEVKGVGDEPCFHLTISIAEIEYDGRIGHSVALRGTVNGRCYGTVIWDFRLTRAA